MTRTDPAIAFLPYRMKLGRSLSLRPVADLHWPLGCPERLRGKTVGEMAPSDHIILAPETAVHYLPNRGSPAQFSLVMGEPSYIHAKHLRLLRWTWRRFYRVLTFHQSLVDSLPNAEFFPYGTTWVPNWRDLSPEKTAMCSLIASAKRDSQGHKLRHDVVDWVRDTGQDVQIMGRGYTPFEDKAHGLAPFRYSIVIENGREANYFTEKLLDTVFCRTVPIYWGCPNIDQFCDPSSIIICNSLDDIQRAVAAMSVEDYTARLPGLTALAEELAPYADWERRAAEAIRNSL